MPLVDFNDPTLWDRQYKSWPHGVQLGYHRVARQGESERQANLIINLLNLQDGMNILLIGATYGWTAEHMEAINSNLNVVSLDTSSLVKANKDLPETDDIRTKMIAQGLDPDGKDAWRLAKLDDGGPRSRHHSVVHDDALTGQGRAKLRQLITAQDYDWAVSMQVLTWLADIEVVALGNAMRQVATNTGHFITPWLANKGGMQEEPDPPWNWKTIEGWKAILPSDTIINSYRGEAV